MPSKDGVKGEIMNDNYIKIRTEYLLKIKKIIRSDKNGDKFIIVRTQKNKEFINKLSLTFDDIKNIILTLSVEDCFSGPEKDRDSQYNGWIFKFNPWLNNEMLYIKIRVEYIDKAVCISIHEFGKYDEVKK